MGCNCGNKGPQYAVTMPDGRVVFLSKNQSTAASVASRYEGATVILQDK